MGTLKKNTKHYKMPAFSLIEVVTSTIIILICFLVFSSLFQQLLNSHRMSTQLRIIMTDWSTKAASIKSYVTYHIEEQKAYYQDAPTAIKRYKDTDGREVLTLYLLHTESDIFLNP